MLGAPRAHMGFRRRFACALALLLALAAAPLRAQSDTLRDALAGLAEGRSSILASLEELAALNDPRSLPAIEALVDRRLESDGAGGLYVVESGTGQLRDALTGEPATVDPAALEAVTINNRVRRAAGALLAQLRLVSPDSEVRLAAAASLRSRPSDEAREPVATALAAEQDARVRTALEAVLAQIDLRSSDARLRVKAIERIGALGDRELRSELEPLLAVDAEGTFVEPDEEVRAAAEAALGRIDRRLFFADAVANVFFGLSLASVLLLAALGLAITFGLMGVINMAHGEMLMLGAYTTYVVLGLFQAHAPGWTDAYLLAAIPAAFLVCAL